MPQVKPNQVRLREYDFDTASCEYCRYFKKGVCKVLEIGVRTSQVCDAYQGANTKYKSFRVAEKDLPAFARGMVKMQPYKHIVMKGLDTPVGYLLIIRDTMKPKPHTFSIDMDFSNEHLAREHNWRQKEINTLIKRGRQGGLVRRDK